MHELDELLTEKATVSASELCSLIRLDLNSRWARNDRRPPEEYFHRFPSVAADAELAVDVIYCEYLARERSGERPDLAEYEARFPAFAQVLAEQVRLHHAFDTLEKDDTQGDKLKVDPAARSAHPAAEESAPLETSYEILDQIGRGGMGVVYKARQTALNRLVALKMVRAIDAGNEELLSRFRNEARVVASLRHPHIVHVHDYGQHEGLPFIAMELVEGGSLADRLDGAPWPPRRAAELLAKLADAVQCAHENHVIHRDLKPANVLMASDGPEPNVKVTDFGLAKCFVDEGSPHSHSGAFLGTPSYMAPEQANGRTRDIGPAADIYSLGAILYELLTGQPPIRGDSPLETLRLLLSTEPASIHQFTPRVPRDLATICDKCLQRSPDKRYATASQLRTDLKRYLDGIPVQARRASSVERAWRWCRRNPPLAAALGSVALLLVGIAVMSLWYSGKLRRELTNSQQMERTERESKQLAQRHLWDAYLSKAGGFNASRRVGQRFDALESIGKASELLSAIGRTPDRELQLRNAVLSAVALPDIRPVRSAIEWRAELCACDMSGAADCYVVAATDGTLSGHRISDGKLLWSVKESEQSASRLSSDGQFLAATGKHGTKVWRVNGPEPQLAWEANPCEYFSFSPDCRYAAYSDPNVGMKLARVSDGKVVRPIGVGTASSGFVFNPRTRQVAVCSLFKVQVISLETGAVEAELPPTRVMNPQLAWHPSGDHLAVWGEEDGIALWNIKTRSQARKFEHFGVPSQMCFNEDGGLLAAETLWSNRLLVWQVGLGQCCLEVPDFNSVACEAGPGGRIRFWTVRDSRAAVVDLVPGACSEFAQSLDPPLAHWWHVSASPEGRLVAFSSASGLELWDLKSNRRLAAWKIGQCWAAFDAEGELIVGCLAGVFQIPRRIEAIAGQGELAPFAAPDHRGRTVWEFGPPRQLHGPIFPMSLAISSSGKTLVFKDPNGWALLRTDQDNADQNNTVIRLDTTQDPRNSAVSNDNRHVAIANWESGGGAVWNGESGSHAANLAVGRHGVVQFSPDSQLLAATPDGVTLWRTTDWTRQTQLHLQGTTPTGMGIAFSPDSRVLAVGQTSGVVTLIDSATGREWGRLTSPEWNIASALAFTPDHRWLVTASADKHALVWDLAMLRRELADRQLDLPPDVLQPAGSQASIEGHLEVRLIGGELLPMKEP